MENLLLMAFAVYTVQIVLFQFFLIPQYVRLVDNLAFSRNEKWVREHPEILDRFPRPPNWPAYSAGVVCLALVLYALFLDTPFALLYATHAVSMYLIPLIVWALTNRRSGKIRSAIPLPDIRMASLQSRRLTNLIPAFWLYLFVAVGVVHLGAWLYAGFSGWAPQALFLRRILGVLAVYVVAFLAWRSIVRGEPSKEDDLWGGNARKIHAVLVLTFLFSALLTGFLFLYQDVSAQKVISCRVLDPAITVLIMIVGLVIYMNRGFQGIIREEFGKL